jgi:Ca-activated chloride channel family protein
MNTRPDVVVTPRRPGLRAGSDNDVEVLIRIQAPDAPQEGPDPGRAALNLALVLDRSGSMSGQPLQEAKRCAAYMIDGLRRSDRAAIVIYDHQIQVLVPSTPVLDRNRFKTALVGVGERGNTDLHGGWLRGAEEVAPHVDGRIVSRVLLLSDGCANAGVTDDNTILNQCSRLAEAGVSTSTYGVGRHFNEHLMMGMAKAGQGRSYYSESAEDLMDNFREEFALLRALCSRSLRLFIDLPFDGKVRVINRYPAHPQGGCRLPDLAYDGEAWALARFTMPKNETGSGDGTPVRIARFQVDYLDRDGNPSTLTVPDLALPSLSAEAFSRLAEDELVTTRIGELRAADIQERASAAANRGDIDAVNRILAEASALQSTDPFLSEVFCSLREGVSDQAKFAKEALFQSERLRQRLAAKKEALALQEAEMADYLRRKTRIGKGRS